MRLSACTVGSDRSPGLAQGILLEVRSKFQLTGLRPEDVMKAQI